MAPRATKLGLATCAVLVATFTFTASSFACNGAKSASAASACCASKSHTAACATTSAKTSVAAPSLLGLPRLAGAPMIATTAAFPALPGFAQPQPVVAGLMAYIDPETGLLTGPIGDLQVPDDLKHAFAPEANLTPVTMPDGSVMVDLQGTLQDYYVLTVDPLGRRSIRCVTDARQAVKPTQTVILPIAER